MDFLEVTYGDNDFGIPVEEALKRLWSYINGNNSCAGIKNKSFSGKSTAQIFYKLYQEGVLQTLLERLFVLEYLAFGVEFKTRGLYWAKVDWKKCIIENPSKINYENTYLTFDLKFRKSKDFKLKDQNGEHAYLDLRSGEVGTF